MKLKRTAAHAWIDSIDPLFGVSISAAKSFFNSARRNGSPRLQKIYDEIEMNDPTILTCVERRAAALAGLSRTVTANPAVKDKHLAEEQVAALNEFILNIDNLDEVIEHMDLAFFRGFSVAQPIWLGSAVKHVEIFDSWNFLYGDHGELLWNPKCSMDPKDCEIIGPEAHLLFLKRRRAIDWPALIIYLRKYIGERDWGRFLERYGIPPVDVVMAANATKEDRAEYEKAANAAENGQNVVWPSNSSISRSETSRGQDPFSAFIDHQEREIVLMATGGTLTSLAQADTGALAGGAQMKVWEQIVARDAVLTNAIFNASLVRRFFELNFPGREIAAKFELGPEKTPTPTEVAELATKIKNAGYLVDQHQLEEATGFTLEKIESPSASPFPALNKKSPDDTSPDDTARGDDKLLAAFASDMSPLGDAIKALLNDPSPAAATALIDRLPSLLPDDPALATILAEAMAKEFGVGPASSAASDEHLANSADECRAADPAHCRVHGTPETRPLSIQLSELGYTDRNDINHQADAVSSERIAQIASGDLKEHCKIHEAVAVLRTNPSVKNAFGKDVTFGEDMILHYLGGYGRSNNQSDAKRLTELPLAMHAVKTCQNPHLQYPKGVTPDPLNPPRGTQYVYHEKVGEGDMQCRAWVDSGKVKGWFVK